VAELLTTGRIRSLAVGEHGTKEIGAMVIEAMAVKTA